ncbi:hypothetical protein LCGC14_1083240 [marine sediment metagenome]|uniref:Uncharacterized protein n=1 Tax=marine sediment metagenome TaxID=412755 RepID=A0A0F9MJ57_9ZZZZ
MVFSITSNANIIAKNIGNIARDLPKENKKALTELAIMGKGIAKGIAPVKRGNLKAGITHKVFKDRAEITSRVFGLFPYHLWVNRTIPALNIKSAVNKYFARGQRVVYGGSAVSPSGTPIIWTGLGGYFDITAEVLRKKFGKRFSIAVSNTLKKHQTR